MKAKSTSTREWNEQARECRDQAKLGPLGAERDRLMRQARQLETASQMDDWLESPGRKPPT